MLPLLRNSTRGKNRKMVQSSWFSLTSTSTTAGGSTHSSAAPELFTCLAGGCCKTQMSPKLHCWTRGQHFVLEQRDKCWYTWESRSLAGALRGMLREHSTAAAPEQNRRASTALPCTWISCRLRELFLNHSKKQAVKLKLQTRKQDRRGCWFK